MANLYNAAQNRLQSTLDTMIARPEQERMNRLREQVIGQQLEEGRMTLADAYRKRQEDEELRNALANPPTQTTFAPPQPVTPGVGGLQANPSLTEITGRRQMTPTQIIADTRMKQGRVDEAVKAINLDDALAQYQAKGADPREYYAAKHKLDQGKEFFGIVKEYRKSPEMLKQLWPLIVKAYPDAANVNPDMIRETANGLAVPVTTQDGRVIPNRYYLYDNDGKMHMIEDKPNAETLLDKRLAADAAKTDKLIAARFGLLEKKAQSGGDGTGKPKRAMPASTEKRLTAAAELADAMDRFNGGFQPNYAGKTIMGDTSNTVGKIFGDDTGQAQWWQDYQGYVNDVRQEKFGASLTNNEKNEFLKYIVTPRMSPKQVQENLRRQKQITDSALARLQRGYATQHGADVVEEFTGRPVAPVEAAKAPTIKYGKGKQPVKSGRFTVEEVK